MVESDGAAEQVIGAPTYMANIRFFFRAVDVAHMAAKGLDLGTYDGVKRNALLILGQTAPPHGDMPPDAAGKWTPERWQTFHKWIANGCPQGSAAPPAPGGEPAAAPTRLRKNLTSLGDEEVAKLKAAFSGLMKRDGDPSNPDSYFAIAGEHGLPTLWCVHHEDRFNPWHRVYLKRFEDALRSVEGCEDVTLPYWDIKTPIPELLLHAPFGSYELPRDPGAGAQVPVRGHFPYTTKRNEKELYEQRLAQFAVLAEIKTSLCQSVWGSYNDNGYQDFSIQAHDGGHGSIGPTMNSQDVAAYDPIFWFFHCNLDRLWLSWQSAVGATTLDRFRTTLSSDHTDWLEAPFNAIPPFEQTAEESIEYGIAYDELEADAYAETALENTVGSLDATRSFSIKRSSPISVRVKGIDRLAIPGSFEIHLLADGAPIARRFFFQPTSPRDCAGCRKNALINIDFRIDRDEILDRRLSVELHVPGHEDIGSAFPLSQAGSPTINARLLLEDE